MRNKNIDIYKGICIIFVIITHCEWSNYHRQILLFPFWIDMAVPMFMIISGYAYSVSYVKNRIVTLSEAYSVKNTIKYMIRYTIPFLIAYLLEVILYIMHGEKISYLDVIQNFMRGGWGRGSYYYPIMVQFVFCFPLIYFVVNKYRLKGVVICFVTNSIYELLQWAYEMNDSCYRLLLFRYIFVISFGCYLLLEDNKQLIKKWQYIISFIIGIAFIIGYSYLEYEPIIITRWTGTSLIACLYIIPIAAYIINTKNHLRGRFLELLGKASYNIFLVQMVYFGFFETIIHNVVSGNEVLKLLIAVVINVLIGIAFYYIEAPLTKCICKKLNASLI